MQGNFRAGQRHQYKHKIFTSDHVTFVHNGTADGQLLTTTIIFQGNIPKEADLPPTFHYLHSSSGFMNKILFLAWLTAVVVPYAQNKKDNVLLLLNNCNCHLGIHGIQ